MKKISLILIALLAVATIACKKNDNKANDAAIEQIKAEIVNANKACPIDLGIVGTMTSVEYDEDANNVIYTITISKNLPDGTIETMRQNKGRLADQMKGTISQPKMRQMMNKIVEANASLTFKYTGQGDDIDITITADDIKESLAKPTSTADNAKVFINNSVEMENSRCPYKVDEATTMLSARLDGDYVIYQYRVDDSQLNIEDFDNAARMVKNNILNMFHNDVALKQFAEALVSLNKSLIYRYEFNNSPESIDIVITTDELR